MAMPAGERQYYPILFREPKSHTTGGSIPPQDSKSEEQGLPRPAVWAVI